MLSWRPKRSTEIAYRTLDRFVPSATQHIPWNSERRCARSAMTSGGASRGTTRVMRGEGNQRDRGAIATALARVLPKGTRDSYVPDATDGDNERSEAAVKRSVTEVRPHCQRPLLPSFPRKEPAIAIPPRPPLPTQPSTVTEPDGLGKGTGEGRPGGRGGRVGRVAGSARVGPGGQPVAASGVGRARADWPRLAAADCAVGSG